MHEYPPTLPNQTAESHDKQPHPFVVEKKTQIGQAISQLQDGDMQALEATESAKEKETELRAENEELRTRLSQVVYNAGFPLVAGLSLPLIPASFYGNPALFR